MYTPSDGADVKNLLCLNNYECSAAQGSHRDVSCSRCCVQAGVPSDSSESKVKGAAYGSETVDRSYPHKSSKLNTRILYGLPRTGRGYIDGGLYVRGFLRIRRCIGHTSRDQP